MRRREFVAKSCMACLGGSMAISLLSGCRSGYYTTGQIEDKGLSIDPSEFAYERSRKHYFRKSIIVHHPKLEFPIYLYRISETEYNALWMKCTHQGSELNAAGDHLYCTSHGSEFDKHGNVRQGPAEQKLRSFPVSIDGDKLLITLS